MIPTVSSHSKPINNQHAAGKLPGYFNFDQVLA